MSPEIRATPPVAARIPHPHVAHGVTRPDDYYWLRERDNPEVLRLLEAENAYLNHIMEPLAGLEAALYQELLGRIQEDDQNVPVKDGPYFYYRRTERTKPYPIYARKRAGSRPDLPSAPEEVLLDQNALADGKPLYNLTVQRVSPDHTRLAYLDNETGTDRYTLRVKNLATGEMLPDRVEDVHLYGSLEWDPSGTALFYIAVDPVTQRSRRLCRHVLGEPADRDEEIYDEGDITYVLYLHRSQSGRFLFLMSHSTTTHEVRCFDAQEPSAGWRLFQPRRPGVRYSLEHWGDDFLVLTDDGAPDMKLLAAPIQTAQDSSSWRELLAHVPGRPLDDVTPFSDQVLVSGREDGLAQVWVLDRERLRRVEWPERLYTVHPGDNREYMAATALLTYQSMVTPSTVFELDLATLGTTLVKQDPVRGGYRPEDYVQERFTIPAEDGTPVPVSLVYKRGARAAGPAPLIVDGYGSYGATSDPHFQTARLPLLDRGIIMAVAHVRGGGEMGRAWYEGGKLMRKMNTFTDFVAVAKGLVERGYTTPGRLAARGRSAGGLLMGAVANLAPDLFRVIVAGVPFVDVLTTMLDETIPLTSLEWDEWGNPAQPDAYRYMATYSPYDNVEPKAYPALYVHTGLNDPRVGYFEPAKWVARLRALKTDANPLVLRTEMAQGHSGASNRYERLKTMAREDAFVLHQLGVDA